jgi:actin-related protein
MTPVVIDYGSAMLKGGISGDDEPLTCFATVTGRHRYGMDNRCVCGSEALIRKGSLRLSYSMERGNINNSNDTASLIRHFFSELKVNPSEQPCLITERNFD